MVVEVCKEYTGEFIEDVLLASLSDLLCYTFCDKIFHRLALLGYLSLLACQITAKRAAASSTDIRLDVTNIV